MISIFPVLAGLIAAAAGGAHAEQEARQEGEVRLLVPSFQLSASTEGAARFKAGLGVLFSTGELNIILTPRLEVATVAGIGTLLSNQQGISPPWLAGATLSVAHSAIQHRIELNEVSEKLGNALYDNCVVRCSSATCDFKASASAAERRGKSPEDLCESSQQAYKEFEESAPHAPELKVALYNSCALQCVPGKPCAFDKAAPAEAKGRFPPEKLCPTSKVVWERGEEARPFLYGIRPTWKLSAGFQRGAQVYSYLDGTPGAGAPLSETVSTFHNTRAGLSGYALAGDLFPGHALTLEGHALYDFHMDPSLLAARYCVSVGQVNGAEAQSCRDRQLGAPTPNQSFVAAVDVGVVPRLQDFWRVALGAFYRSQLSGGGGPVVGLELPLYFNFANFPNPAFPKAAYRGILRVTPVLGFQPDGRGAVSTTAAITLDILGDNSLFPDALDYPQ